MAATRRKKAPSTKKTGSSRTTGKASPKKKGVYDEEAIKTLDALEHIRLRTGMYIGRIGTGAHPQDGVYIMLKEVIDNAIDEFIMGHGKRIIIEHDGQSVSIRDYGRGIPLGKVVDCVSKINTGGKYNDDVFQFSVGLNGVGTKAVNALSSDFEVISWREGKYKRATFSQGRLLEEKGGKDTQPNGTMVRFVPDPEIFKRTHWKEEFIVKRLNYYAYLNAGLTLQYKGTEGELSITSKQGLKDLLLDEMGNTDPLYEPVHIKSNLLEITFTHTHNYGETYFSFVNGQYTNDGGTHLSGFREGILKAVNEYAGQNFAGEDVRDGLMGAVAVKLQDPVFESQTKNKLGSTEVRPWVLAEVKKAATLWLHKNKKAADLLIEKVRANEKLRKELASVKKQARERAKKTAIRIPKLIDCKDHFNNPKSKRAEQSTIFLTEGDSAGGALVQSRDVYTQAIFSLKGKPVNTFGQKREAIYKNEELYNIMRALGIEDDIEGLRYNYVVIATDADVDGMHIRNLLLTYFLKYFDELVLRGHVYILETPLFRVRNKQKTQYCYSDKERDEALGVIKGAEVTRFKGLGEISPKEFKQFIGDDIRLTPVVLEKRSDIDTSLAFYMGRNTPERKEFIVDNLLVDVV